MASFCICNCKHSLWKTQTDLKHNLASLPSLTRISFSPSLPRHSSSGAKFGKLSLKSLTLRRLLVVNRVDKSLELLNSSHETMLKIGIIGFGTFGQFIAKGLQKQGHKVLATSRSDYSDNCQKHGIEFFGNVDGLCESQPDVVLVCSSIISTEAVIRGIPFDKLKPDTIFADVLSVKQFPTNLFLEGCRMVEMSCEEHDRHAAGSQFVTHTIGRQERLGLVLTVYWAIINNIVSSRLVIDAHQHQGIRESLAASNVTKQTKNIVSDSFDLYYGLFMYNVNATEQIENLDRAFETVKQKLFGRLHDILRKQIVERVPVKWVEQQEREPTSKPYFLPSTGDIKDLTSFGAPVPQQEWNYDDG